MSTHADPHKSWHEMEKSPDIKSTPQEAAAAILRGLSSPPLFPHFRFAPRGRRCLGGLLAAHEMSGDAYLLQMADDLGQRLVKAFAAPSGLPYTTISLSTGAHSVPAWTGGNLLLAEV
jgi:hypothetical protein